MRALLFCGIARERTPYDGYIDIPALHRVNDARGRIRLSCLAKEIETDHVASQAPARKKLSRRRIILAHNMNADAHLFETRIRQRRNIQSTIVTRNEDVRGAV